MNTPKTAHLLEDDDMVTLREACGLLRCLVPNVKISSFQGDYVPLLSYSFKFPEGYERRIVDTVNSALLRSVRVVRRLNPSAKSNSPFSLAWWVGKSLGIRPILAEIRASTDTTIRSIFSAAQSEGFEMRNDRVQAECLKVFGLVHALSKDNEYPRDYYYMRAALDESTGTLEQERGVNLLAQVLSVVTPRYTELMTAKVEGKYFVECSNRATRMFYGDFYRLFDRIARGHFMVKRLESKYGADIVRSAFDDIRASKDASLESEKG